MNFVVLCCLLVASALAATKEISRPKRASYIVYFMCNNNGNRFVSNYPCSYNQANYGYNNIPQSFYDPYNNCNTGCSSLSCNNYNGQYINGQYVAYSTSNSQYSPCASSCCASLNPPNNPNNIGFGASPNTFPPNTVNDPNNPNNIGFGAAPNQNPPPNPNNVNNVNNFNNNPNSNPNNIGFGVSSNSSLVSRSKRQYNSCRSGETPIAQCSNGRCPYNLMCSSSNQCCLCGDGISAGPCAGGCPSGYLCASSGQCCRGYANPPTSTFPPITTQSPGWTFPPITTSTQRPGGGLQQCGMNRSCPNGFTCGDGNVCFPWIIGK